MNNFMIHSPLLIFDRVHRRTGSIDRTCVITNQKSENMELEVRYDFPEHSWVQIYGLCAQPREPLNGQPLTLQPGENKVVVSLNTDNFNFPDRRFKGRILFQDRADESSKEWIEINFDHVQELEPFQGYAAIDLGTSSSTISLYHFHRDAVWRMPWTPKLHREHKEIPSAVFIRSFQKFLQHAPGGSFIGEDALRAYRTGNPKDPRCLQLSTKQMAGGSRVLATDEKGTGGFVDPLELLYALAKHVRESCQNNSEVHALLRKVSVTFPPTWSYRQLTAWRELFRRLGFKEEELDFSLDEASAAGLFYLYSCIKDRDSFGALIQDLLESEVDINEEGRKGKGYTLNLLSFDFGGGTIDLALLEAKLHLFPKTIRLRLSLLGSDSCDYGGDQVTLTVFRILKRRLAMALCDPARLYAERVQNGAANAPAEVSPPAWLTPRTAAVHRGREETFLLPDSAAASTAAVGGWNDGSSDRLEASREALRHNWGYLAAHIMQPRLESEIEDAVEALFPTRFLPSEEDLFRLNARRRFDWLWQQAESLKRRLFEAVQRDHGKDFFPSFDLLKRFRSGISLADIPDPQVEETIPWASKPAAETAISVGADEVFQGIAEPLEAALAKARKLAEGRRVDRVALSGQSCRIPVVRWMLGRAEGEGGLGIPPAKIVFDEENAKAAVSKGACLLHVMRETLVGFEVDIADFKANLLSDLFYLQVDGSRRELFKSGSIDDFSYFEELPETRSFPKYLSIFYGSEQNLIGQFLFREEGTALPPPPVAAPAAGAEPSADGALPTHQELMDLRRKDRPRYSRWVSRLLQWGDRERIAWMERTAKPGSSDAPIYRYYLTRNQTLYAVRDAGPGGKLLHELKSSDSSRHGPRPEDNPFSGIH